MRRRLTLIERQNQVQQRRSPHGCSSLIKPVSRSLNKRTEQRMTRAECLDGDLLHYYMFRGQTTLIQLARVDRVASRQTDQG